MKKIVATLLVTMLLSQTALAAGIETRVDFDTRDVTVSGSVEQASFNRMISVIVSDEQKQYYVGTVGTNSSGAYDFIFRMPEDSETGYYTIAVDAIGLSEPIKQEFYYAKKADIDNALSSINGAADVKAAQSAIEGNMAVLNIPEDWYNSLGSDGKEAVAESLFNGKPYQMVGDATNVIYNELAVQAFRYAADDSEIEKALNDFADVYNINSDTAVCYELYTTSDFGKNAREIMVGYDTKNIDEIIAAYNESVLLAAINNAKDPYSIQTLISEYRDVIPFSLNTYDEADKEKVTAYLYRNGNFKSMTDLENAIEDAYENQNNSGGGTGSVGSGGGGSYPSSSGSGTIASPPTISNKPISTPTPDKPGIDTESFDDISDAEWAREAIEYLSDKKIVNGVGDNRFEPNGVVTREQFVVMVMNALDLYDDNAISSFEDMPESHWAYKAVSSACSKGIIFGQTDNIFGTGESITRQDMAVIAYRAAQAAGYSLDGTGTVDFTDEANISEYAFESVSAMSANGIINGYPDGRFAPGDTATRAQAAQIIYSLVK